MGRKHSRTSDEQRHRGKRTLLVSARPRHTEFRKGIREQRARKKVIYEVNF